jgi:hypothetical protein
MFMEVSTLTRFVRYLSNFSSGTRILESFNSELTPR